MPKCRNFAKSGHAGCELPTYPSYVHRYIHTFPTYNSIAVHIDWCHDVKRKPTTYYNFKLGRDVNVTMKFTLLIVYLCFDLLHCYNGVKAVLEDGNWILETFKSLPDSKYSEVIFVSDSFDSDQGPINAKYLF